VLQKVRKDNHNNLCGEASTVVEIDENDEYYNNNGDVIGA
jgi:hypothetical protein